MNNSEVSCPTNLYYDRKNDQCLPCHGTCSSCVGPSHMDCTNCHVNHYMLAPSKTSTPFQCASVCSESSETLPGMSYNFCLENSSTFKIPTTSFPSEQLVIQFIILISIVVLILFILAVLYILITRFSKNTKQIPESTNQRLLPLTQYDAVELKTIPMSSLDWDHKMIIGKGRFGCVYKCYCKDVGIDVAVKELSNKEDTSHTRFLKEIEIMSQLRHPNLTRILGFNYTTNLRIITLLRKYDLARYLLRLETIEVQDLIRFCFEIADAMVYLHSRNIVHCDLKASNILVKDEFTVEVADFGLAGIIKDNNRIGGTLTHMPFEYLTKNVDEPTKEGDVWSFGVTVWEIFTLCKQKPYSEFSIDSPMKMIELLKNGTRLPRPSLLYEHLPLWSVVINCNVTLNIFQL